MEGVSEAIFRNNPIGEVELCAAFKRTSGREWNEDIGCWTRDCYTDARRRYHGDVDARGIPSQVSVAACRIDHADGCAASRFTAASTTMGFKAKALLHAVHDKGWPSDWISWSAGSGPLRSDECC